LGAWPEAGFKFSELLGSLGALSEVILVDFGDGTIVLLPPALIVLLLLPLLKLSLLDMLPGAFPSRPVWLPSVEPELGWRLLKFEFACLSVGAEGTDS